MDPNLLSSFIVAAVAGGGLIWGWLSEVKQIEQINEDKIEEEEAPVVREQKWPSYWVRSWAENDGPSADA